MKEKGDIIKRKKTPNLLACVPMARTVISG